MAIFLFLFGVYDKISAEIVRNFFLCKSALGGRAIGSLIVKK